MKPFDIDMSDDEEYCDNDDILLMEAGVPPPPPPAATAAHVPKKRGRKKKKIASASTYAKTGSQSIDEDSDLEIVQSKALSQKANESKETEAIAYAF